MRLLDTQSHEVREFGDGDVPFYAILSHRWDAVEVSLQDLRGGDAGQMAAYSKIRNSCSLAASHGFQHLWIDTCCIDKTSSAELSESLNSMYRWYRESMVCYAYLGDVPSDSLERRTGVAGRAFGQSAWFTRGWTLQELIAPPTIVFLDQAWQEIGAKSSLLPTLSRITGIPSAFLQGDDLDKASIAERMSWASGRRTTRPEDMAYCLMGLFGVNMPMLYGEGQHAFIRLQEEIIKISDDHSIFAWKEDGGNDGILATSPAAFSDSGNIIPLEASSARGTLDGAITLNNKGIHLKLRLARKQELQHDAVLPCRVRDDPEKLVVLHFRAIPPGAECFKRIGHWLVTRRYTRDYLDSKCPEITVCVGRGRQKHPCQWPILRATQLGRGEMVRFLLDRGADHDVVDDFGQTPLALAGKMGYEGIVCMLLEHGADPNAEDDCGRTPLLWAAGNGHTAVAKLLLEKEANPNATMRDSLSVQWLALASGDRNPARTPLARAKVGGHDAMVVLLREWGAWKV